MKVIYNFITILDSPFCVFWKFWEVKLKLECHTGTQSQSPSRNPRWKIEVLFRQLRLVTNVNLIHICGCIVAYTRGPESWSARDSSPLAV